ncbi:MAG: rhodanese-like domain-containing protein [bacterium]|nr:rhodanese-like domain-containing protein [bacterium]MDZ4225206.1 rhodanese-like domain-containing protein [bacterium]
MTGFIKTSDLKAKMDNKEDFVLVEVLGPETFAEFHLPGAINVTVDDTFEEEIQKAVPDKNKTVVVYCRDIECHASAKATRRMEALGYTNLLEYHNGKDGWRAAGLPVDS